MKKISLNSVKEFLTRDEMRQITGGTDTVSCACAFDTGAKIISTHVSCDSCLSYYANWPCQSVWCFGGGNNT